MVWLEHVGTFRNFSFHKWTTPPVVERVLGLGQRFDCGYGSINSSANGRYLIEMSPHIELVHLKSESPVPEFHQPYLSIYSLVIEHSDGKWSIYRWFTYSNREFSWSWVFIAILTLPEGKSHKILLNHHFPMVFLWFFMCPWEKLTHPHPWAQAAAAMAAMAAGGPESPGSWIGGWLVWWSNRLRHVIEYIDMVFYMVFIYIYISIVLYIVFVHIVHVYK